MRWVAIVAVAFLAAGQGNPPADGIDLLPLIDLSRDAVHGEWQFSSDGLSSPPKVASARVQIPYVPPEEYDLTLVVERKEGDYSLEVGLASGPRQFHVGLDGWGAGDLTGLYLVDGKANQNFETTYQGKLLQKDSQATLVCSVRKTGVAMVVDGKKILDWKGDLKRLTAAQNWEVPSKISLFIGSWTTRFLIHRMLLVPVSGTGRALREWSGEADLISRVDPRLDSPSGAWTVSEGKLVSRVLENGIFACCFIPYLPPAEYDLTVVAELRQGKGPLFLGLIGGGKTLGLQIGEAGGIAAEKFSDGKMHSVTCRVRKDKLVIAWDGTDLQSLTADDTRILKPAEIASRGGKTLTLGSRESEYVLHRVTATPVNGAGTFLRALDPTPSLQAADLKFQTKDYPGALEDYTLAIRADPASSRGWTGRGVTRKLLGDLQGAEAELSRALELNSKDDVALLNRGQVYFGQEKFAAAMADAKRALAIKASAPAWHLQAQVFHAQGEAGAAKTSLDRELALDPRAVSAYVLRSVEKLAFNDHKGALADLDQAIALDDRLPEAYANRSKVRTLLRDKKGADEDLAKALELRPGYAAAYQLRASGKYEIGDSQGAFADCAVALELDPKYVWTYQTLGYTHRHLGDYIAALRDFEQALALEPKRAIRWTHRGTVRRALGDPAGALTDFSRAIELQATATGYVNRAELRRDTGDLAGALSDATEAIALSPDGSTRYYLRGCILSDLGDYAKAEQDLIRAIQIYGDSSHYQRTLGQIRMRARKFTSALEDLNRAALQTAGERDANHEERAFALEYFGDVHGAFGDAWWAVYYGERHGHGVAGLELLRRLEMDR